MTAPPSRHVRFLGRATESAPELSRHDQVKLTRAHFDHHRLDHKLHLGHHGHDVSDGSDSDDEHTSDGSSYDTDHHASRATTAPFKDRTSAASRQRKHMPMADLGLSAGFQEQVTAYQREWHSPWSPIPKLRSPGASLQSINPARQIYERGRRKDRQGSLDGAWAHVHILIHTLRVIVRSKPVRAFAILLNLVTDAVLTVLYLVEMSVAYSMPDHVPMAGFDPPWLWIPRPLYIWIIASVLSFINLFAFVSRVVLSQDPFRSLMNIETLVEFLTTGPFLVAKFLDNGALMYIPYFLRSIPFISRLRRFMHIRLELSDTIEQVDAIQGKLVNVVATIITIIYTTMCAFQYAQVMFDNQALTALDALYLTVVTLSTVGFGDVTSKSWQGRIVVIVAIIVAFVSVPKMVSSALETWRIKRNGGGVFVKHTTNPHVVFIGRFDDPSLVTALLQALFHNEGSRPLQVVFLSRRRPSLPVKALINAPLFRNRIFFIQGSALKPTDLDRVQISTADAAFFISNNTTAEDERNVLRVWSVVRHAPLTHLYIYTHRPEFERYHTVHSTAVVCADEMKQSLLGSNCIHRGVAALIINLVSTMSPADHYDQPWMAQYGDGLGHEIYSLPTPELFQGKRFHHVAAYLFLEFQVVAIAVRIPIMHRSREFETVDYHVILNPGSEYVLRGNEDIVCIAQGLHEINLVLAMTKDQFDESLLHHPPIFSTKAATGLPAHFTSRQQSTRSSSLFSSSAPIIPTFPPTPYTIGQPDTPYSDNRKVALCHLLRKPPKRVEDVLVDDGMQFTGHMIVITATWQLSRFLCTVRGAHIPAEDLRPILFLSTTLPTPDEFRFLAPFPLVSFMVANARRRKDLQRANVIAADRVVILPDANSRPQTGDEVSSVDEVVDLGPILTRHLVAHVAARATTATTSAGIHEPMLMSEDPKDLVYTIVELVDPDAIKYLDPSADVTGVGGTHHYHLHPLQATPWHDDDEDNDHAPGHSGTVLRSDTPEKGTHGTASDTVVELGPLGGETRSATSVDLSAAPFAAAVPPRPTTAAQRDTRRRLRRRIDDQSDIETAPTLSTFVPLPKIDLMRLAARPERTSLHSPPASLSSSGRTAKAIPPRWQMFYMPQYASGEAFCPSLLDTILVSHYYNPVVLDIVKLFAGIRTRTNLRLDRELGLTPSFLYTIDVPREYVGRPFKDLFAGLCIEYGVVTLGLYRAPCSVLGNDAHFVYTAPHPEVVLKADDVVYLLSKVWRDESRAESPAASE
ncbi:potassium channel, sub T, member 2 [Allomyces arbusculus]|nr:potassium channel, sub T, member 2 [Allomyces arbusculus]